MFLKSIVPQSLRCIHSSVNLQGEVNKQLLSKLRKTTGFPFIKCSEALEKFDNDINQAEKWMRDEAQKEGWSKATKLQGRPMSQGLIGLSISDNVASMVEVNCETDFVARNMNFQSFVNKITKTLLQYGKDNKITKATLDQSQLAKLKANGKQISDLTALEIGNLGENILVRRGVLLRPKDGQMMSAYVHTTGTKNQQSEDICLMGKYGALVICKEDPLLVVPGEGDQEKKLTTEELGKQLCQHIVGMNPTSIGSFEDDLTQKSGDEARLLHQEYMFDNEVTIKDVLRRHGVNVIEFARMECGEELGVKSETQEPLKAVEC